MKKFHKRTPPPPNGGPPPLSGEAYILHLFVVRRFQQREIPLKTFHRNVFKIIVLQAANRAERSCSLRPRKAVAFLTHLLRAPKSTGARNFAVCGQRLSGHVPSKNTSPAALSWSSLTNSTTPFLFVFARKNPSERLRRPPPLSGEADFLVLFLYIKPADTARRVPTEGLSGKSGHIPHKKFSTAAGFFSFLRIL